MASRRGYCEDAGSEMKEAATRGHSLPTHLFCHLPHQEEAAHSLHNRSRWLQRCWAATPSTAGISPHSCSTGLTLPQHRKTVNPTSPPASPSIRPLWAPAFIVRVQTALCVQQGCAGWLCSTSALSLALPLATFPSDARSHPPSPSVEADRLFSQDLGKAPPSFPGSQHSNPLRGPFAAA